VLRQPVERNLSPATIAVLAIAGAVYAVAVRFFLLDFIATPAGIALIRGIDHAVRFSLMRLLFGQYCYVILLVPVTVVLAWMRVRAESAIWMLLLYALVMMVTAYVALHLWPRVAMGLWFSDLFAVIVSIAVHMALFVGLRTAADKAARRRTSAA
jgi:hypothetical protein